MDKCIIAMVSFLCYAEKKVLQGHPAFYASIQIELAEEADKLLFENEHQLGTKPKETTVAERLIQEYGKHRSDNLYKSVMDIIVRANSERFEEDSVMCEALEELMQKKIVELEHKAEKRGMERGIERGIEKGIEKGIKEGREELIIECLKRNKDSQVVADFLGIPVNVIEEIEKKMMIRA